MRKIIVLNQKGGVGKTTTVADLGACLAEAGRRVLLLDADPQGHLGIHYGLDVGRGEPSLYTLMRGEDGLADVVRATRMDNLSIIPSNIDLAGLPVELSGRPDRLFVLRKALAELPPRYDYLLMDSPPSLGLLTVNAICAAAEIFIPLQTEFFALQGLSKLLRTILRVQKTVNKGLKLSGVIPVMHDARTRLAQETLADIRAHFGRRVFDTVIRKNVRLAEAPGFGVPITLYDEDCHGAQDYRALAREVIAMEALLAGAFRPQPPQQIYTRAPEPSVERTPGLGAA